MRLGRQVNLSECGTKLSRYWIWLGNAGRGVVGWGRVRLGVVGWGWVEWEEIEWSEEE